MKPGDIQQGHPVLSVAAMRAWEAASWAAGVGPSDVIRSVGAGLANWIRSRFPSGGRVLLLCGRGNNGADVRAAADLLPGWEVDLVEVIDPGPALARLRSALAARPALVVDGLFGIGLNKPLAGAWVALVSLVNDAGLDVLAMDVPSGLDADTGEIRGAAIEARWTLTVGAPKRGLLEARAARWVGRLEVLSDVGLIQWREDLTGKDGWMGAAREFAGWPPRRDPAGHKGAFGHVCLFAGNVGYHGAAVLAARAALRARPGLVTVVTPAGCLFPVASQLAAVMVHPWRDGMDLPARTTCVLFGPGLAGHLPRGLVECLRRLWSGSPLPVVADASGLDHLPAGGGPAGALRVVTPHPGEAGRLLGIGTDVVEADRSRSVRRLSERIGGGIAVLKGRGTLVMQAGGEPWLNPTGNVGLAQGGTGDVLAGFLAGSLAQPGLAVEALRTVRGAVFRHGEAADQLEARGEPWSAEDLAGTVRW